MHGTFLWRAADYALTVGLTFLVVGSDDQIGGRNANSETPRSRVSADARHQSSVLLEERHFVAIGDWHVTAAGLASESANDSEPLPTFDFGKAAMGAVKSQLLVKYWTVKRHLPLPTTS